MTMFHPALPLGMGPTVLPEDEAFTEKIGMVLGTPTGTVPWRPDFGCNLDALVGQPATVNRVNKAETKVQQAMSRWLSDFTVLNCQVKMVQHEEVDTYASGQLKYQEVPTAESALMSLGTQVALEVQLDVETPEGPMTLQAVLD